MNSKYRVWCKNKHEWEKDRMFMSPDGKLFEMLPTGRLVQVRKDTHIIQWFTGLHDKNGKEIFEGDIVNEPSWWWGPGYVVLDIGHVGHSESICNMSWVTSRNIKDSKLNRNYNEWDFNKIEVIGNILEDKEKLNF